MWGREEEKEEGRMGERDRRKERGREIKRRRRFYQHAYLCKFTYISST
jgi:hypothetical protein